MAPIGLVLASHQFTDVPNSNPFHGDISAIADAGVTSGCGGGKFCPDRNVTRAEMAAFMNRLGALAANKTPVVNADKVDGLDSSELLARWALVNADGTIADQSGGITMASSFSGGYYLNFGSSVEGHAIVATIKYRNAAPANSNGFAIVGPCGIEGTTCGPAGTNNPNHVWVLTRDGAGAQTGRPFYVAVLP
jgi:hypothetical protein